MELRLLGRMLALTMGLVLMVGAHPVVQAQDAETGSLEIHVLDCRGADHADLSTCSAPSGVPFYITCYNCESFGEQLVRTGADGAYFGSLPTGKFFKVAYETEIAWTSEPVYALPALQFADFFNWDHESLTFILIEPDLAVAGHAALTVTPLDCSQGDPSDTATCHPIAGLQFLITLRDAGGVFTNDDYTDEAGTRVFETMTVPMFLTVSFDLDYVNFDLVSQTPTKSAVLLDGDEVELVFIFTAPDQEGPITELPDTGSGECAVRLC